MKKYLLTFTALFAAATAFAQGQSTIQSWDFNSGIPTGWTQSTNATDGGFGAGSASSLSSQYFTITDPGSNILATNDDDCNCDKADEYLITDTLDLSNYSVLHATFKSFYYGATYSGSTESAEFLYTTNGGTTWTSLADIVPGADWTSQWIDVSAACGNSNVQFAFNYQDAGGWLYGLGIDDFSIFAPYNFDLATESLDMFSTVGLNNAPYTIEGTIKNYGGTTITSMDLNYKINNGTTVTQSLTGLSIAPYQTYTYSHGTTWNPTTTGTYTVDVWASSLNGGNDQNNSNDTLKSDIEVISVTAEKTLLAESFISSTTPMFSWYNPTYLNLLVSNNANSSNSRITSVNYHMNWPQPNNDPAYNSQAYDRRIQLDINSTPDIVLSGYNSSLNSSPSQLELDDILSEPAIVEIVASWGFTGSYIQCDAEVKALKDIGNNIVIHMAMIEKEISHSIVSNGADSSYTNVFRKFMDGSSGHFIGSMTSGSTYNHYANSTITVSAAPASGSFDFWVGTSNMDIIVWLQDNTTGEVLQAAYAEYTTSSVNEMDNFARYIAVYPNPANDIAGVEIDLMDRANVAINVVNAMGQTVFTEAQTLDAGTQKINLETSTLSAGLYFVNVNVNGVSKTLRLNVAH
ncbi:MAG: T9SS type A sorting domain-containing protein [Cryomorphaceae bacterium]|nr:T9SS type A sorting domain-containing protein [Cryomorphaceae bacterium]